ncbi:ABC transporter ATP-binding protein [Salinibacterium sp. SYSU T00001]|uniref:dipeptide ABC transporter ATP-binding protein n=1 Tax=Homoserinimonas sedimenticola TaxID=2986805 RepID=UPI002235FEB1|nr:ABC transporter ATP-binding protein [Salinibacterium sedimenticola]MCW4384670.1 ABC transporter ATP-binding protein [Salinibacterium sedimenticola]
MSEPLLSVEDLRVSFSGVAAVDGVSFDVAAGECLALVGESGSGKSVTARSLLGLAGSSVTAQRLSLGGRDLLRVSPRDWREIRGGEIGLVLQDALVSLDPLRPVGREIDDALRLHTTLKSGQRRERVIELLHAVGMPEPETRAGQRAGELSGGLRQRALIASAIAAGPRLLIADEPTTALDATVQAQVLQLLGELRSSGTALLLISHDLAVVREVSDRVAVMRAGRIVESGATEEVLRNPQHEYTRELIRSVPSGVPRGVPLLSPASASTDERRTAGAVILEARGVSKVFPRRHAAPLLAVDDVSLRLARGSTLGLVGESGSGKTTLARLLLGLEEPDSGTVLLDDEPFSDVPERSRRPRRRMLGAVYQDPLSSFDPRHSVRRILLDAVGKGAEADRRIAELLDAVGLPSAVLLRRPLHLSGGQRQRVAIARALAPRPAVIVCDEPVSALDVSVQAQVLDLLDELQREFGLAYLFISHDLGVVQHVSDRIAVMRAGRIVEEGEASEVFASPSHEYTRRLLASSPRLDLGTE